MVLQVLVSFLSPLAILYFSESSDNCSMCSFWDFLVAYNGRDRVECAYSILTGTRVKWSPFNYLYLNKHMEVNSGQSKVYSRPPTYADSATCICLKNKLVKVCSHWSFLRMPLFQPLWNYIFLCLNSRFEINDNSIVSVKMKNENLS